MFKKAQRYIIEKYTYFNFILKTVVPDQNLYTPIKAICSRFYTDFLMNKSYFPLTLVAVGGCKENICMYS